MSPPGESRLATLRGPCRVSPVPRGAGGTWTSRLVASEYTGTRAPTAANSMSAKESSSELGVSRRRLNPLLWYPDSQAQLEVSPAQPQCQGCRGHWSATSDPLVVPAVLGLCGVFCRRSSAIVRKSSLAGGPAVGRQKQAPNNQDGDRRPAQISTLCSDSRGVGFEGGDSQKASPYAGQLRRRSWPVGSPSYTPGPTCLVQSSN